MGGMYVVTVSLCMIVKNEEDVLARCLDSVKDLVDEIIIVDTGSKDRTKEIAHTYTDNVFDFVWIDDFAAARNFAFSKAKCMYCMWLDADDVILAKDQEGFQRLKETLSPETDMVMMKYHTAFDSSGKPTFSYYRERLIANHKGYQWVGAVHEIIPPTGNIYYSDDAAVSHKKLRVQDPDRNLRIFEKLIAQGNVLDARQQFYYARELYYHNQFEKAIQVFNAFLQREDAWVENQIDACTFIFYCRRQMGQKQEALYALFQSFVYDEPRAETCCEIGDYFMECNAYQRAIYWYQTAANTARRDTEGGFIQPDCYDYIPYMQMCVCYDKLGDYDTANYYNEKAGDCKPNDKAYLLNKQYFQKRFEES